MTDILLRYHFIDRGGNTVYRAFALKDEPEFLGQIRLKYEDNEVVSLEWDETVLDEVELGD